MIYSNGNTIYETVRAAKLMKQIYVCNCQEICTCYKHPGKKYYECSRYHRTQATEEGTCVHCGYYAYHVEEDVFLGKRVPARSHKRHPCQKKH